MMTDWKALADELAVLLRSISVRVDDEERTAAKNTALAHYDALVASFNGNGAPLNPPSLRPAP